MTNGNRAPRRILHTSDFQIRTLQGEGCRNLETVVTVAVKTKVDLVLIAGDLFDHDRIDDEVVSFTAEQLKRLSVPSIILPGNHDCLAPDSAYHRAELWQSAPNVRIFKAPEGETLDLPDLGISVWGKPMVSHDGNFQPLAGIPQPQEKDGWHIAVAHGYYVGDGPALFPSFHITDEEIITSGQDYIALGHWPVFRCVCHTPVTAYYCDSPPGSVNIVDLIDGIGVQVSRYHCEVD